ncbi:MAG: cohesin domain-containing protein [Halobacteriota archaeon]|nr:cohesin domain-containing protein [Halobacteriota archaeon]
MARVRVVSATAIILVLIVFQASAVATTVSVSDATVSTGESTSVPITISDVVNVSGAHILIEYDPSVVYVTAIGNSDLDFETYKDIDNSTGYTRYVVVNLSSPLDGPSMTFAEISLNAVGDNGDSCTIGLDVVSMQDANYDEIPRTIINGTFTIGDLSSPYVTNPSANQTPIPIDTDDDPKWGETSRLNVTVTDTHGIDSVTIDLSSIGGSSSATMNNIGGDLWSTTTSAPVGTIPGTYDLDVSATDVYGNSNESVSIELEVIENGDVNRDGESNLGDGKHLANNALLVPGYEVIEDVASEVNGDGSINLDDGLYLINHALSVSGYEILH